MILVYAKFTLGYHDGGLLCCNISPIEIIASIECRALPLFAFKQSEAALQRRLSVLEVCCPAREQTRESSRVRSSHLELLVGCRFRCEESFLPLLL